RRQLRAARGLVRLLETTAATRRRRMLRDEDRMIAPRRLPAVVLRIRGREPLLDEVAPLLHHARKSPRLEVRALFSFEPELAPERGAREAMKRRVEIDHRDV